MLLNPLSILWPFTKKVLKGFSKNPLPINLARNSSAILLREFILCQYHSAYKFKIKATHRR